MVAEIPIIALSQPRDTLVAAIRTACFFAWLLPSYGETLEPPSVSRDVSWRTWRNYFLSQSPSRRSHQRLITFMAAMKPFSDTLDVPRRKPDLNEGFCIAPEFVDDRERCVTRGV